MTAILGTRSSFFSLFLSHQRRICCCLGAANSLLRDSTTFFFANHRPPQDWWRPSTSLPTHKSLDFVLKVLGHFPISTWCHWYHSALPMSHYVLHLWVIALLKGLLLYAEKLLIELYWAPVSQTVDGRCDTCTSIIRLMLSNTNDSRVHITVPA